MGSIDGEREKGAAVGSIDGEREKRTYLDAVAAVDSEGGDRCGRFGNKYSYGCSRGPTRTGEHRTNRMQSFDRDAEREKGFDRWRKGERSGRFFFPSLSKPESDKKNC